MATETQFLRDLLRDPDDDVTRHVFADWLEERGDQRATAVRSLPETFRLLAGLRKVAATDASEWIEELVRAGSNRLALILSFLRGEAGHLFHESVVTWATSDHLLYTLARTPGRSSIEEVLTRVGVVNEWYDRDLAVHLAAGQPTDALLSALARHLEEPRLNEFWPCLLHEMVIRRHTVEGRHAVERLVTNLRHKGHVLAHLPLCLTAVETELPVSWPSWGTERPPACQMESVLPQEPTGALPATWEAAEPAATGRMREAFDDWVVEARVFEPSHPIEEGTLCRSLFEQLGLACLAGSGLSEGFALRVTPARAFGELFDAAAPAVLGGGHGRRRAFAALEGLTGAVGADCEEVVAAAQRCLWISFPTLTTWHNGYYTVLALGAVRPDGMTLAVLAVTTE
jgi:uncharacterized protein (TIGR02996 family)